MITYDMIKESWQYLFGQIKKKQ